MDGTLWIHEHKSGKSSNAVALSNAVHMPLQSLDLQRSQGNGNNRHSINFNVLVQTEFEMIASKLNMAKQLQQAGIWKIIEKRPPLGGMLQLRKTCLLFSLGHLSKISKLYCCTVKFDLFVNYTSTKCLFKLR